MSNELGNYLYEKTLKQIQSMCTNYSTKILADFIVNKAPSTQIYNISDVIYSLTEKRSNLRVGEDLSLWILQATGLTFSQSEERYMRINTEFTPFVDNLFTYARTNNHLYYSFLLHRLDDNRAVVFFGFMQEPTFEFTICQSIPVEIHEDHIICDIEHLLSAAKVFDTTREVVMNSVEIMKSIFVGYTAALFAMFRDIANQNKHAFRCYTDEETENKSTYFRTKLGDKHAVKVDTKPIILVLRDNTDVERKVNEYKNPRGSIHYSFSWIVRGHYRKLHNPDTVGVNRNGERCVSGYTWIETYTKGDPNLPLLKRETIVIDKREIK